MKKEISLYIHIPFCDHKCIYCDFYSIITLENRNAFLSAIEKEIHFAKNILHEPVTVSTIFFGGGTPSLLGADFIGRIMDVISGNFELTDNCEITLETNPGTVTKQDFPAYKKLGINRLSIGVQSFHDKDLKFLTRIHNKETAINSIKQAADSGFENINLDLIFNLPGQNRNEWIENLSIAANLPVKHISAYSLILERGTILNKMVIDGIVKIGDEDYDADLYELTIDFLEAEGFVQYEVSNFCKEGFECKHNLAYWNHREYIGLGPSAHSFLNGKRWWNFSSLKKYISEINNSGKAVRGKEKLTAREMMEEFIMLALRSKGLQLRIFKSKFGSSWLEEKEEILNSLKNEGMLEFTNDFIKLTKKGYSLCDEILLKII